MVIGKYFIAPNKSIMTVLYRVDASLLMPRSTIPSSSPGTIRRNFSQYISTPPPDQVSPAPSQPRLPIPFQSGKRPCYSLLVIMAVVVGSLYPLLFRPSDRRRFSLLVRLVPLVPRRMWTHHQVYRQGWPFFFDVVLLCVAFFKDFHATTCYM